MNLKKSGEMGRSSDDADQILDIDIRANSENSVMTVSVEVRSWPFFSIGR